MRTSLGLGLGLVLVVGMAGCQARPRVSQPASGEPPRLGASSITPPARAPMSLEVAQRSQGMLAARALSQKTGIPMEPVTGAAPSWWPVGAMTSGLGRGQAATLEGAYQAAVRQARGSSVGGLGVTKASWARLATGDYVAWVQAGTAAVTPLMAPAPEPIAPVAGVPPTQPKPEQSPPSGPGPAPSSPAPGGSAAAPSDAPSWFTTEAREVDGRVRIGASADAPTVKEAPRMAIEAARAALAHVMGRDAMDVQIESTFVKKVGEQYRAYVLVSSPGTIKK